ncbi:MAG TPA: hypothetical protein VJP86_13810 [Vicinamibacterales bacterium]|nr:hypothetical protein [Vicinamibacterales bacterium]
MHRYANRRTGAIAALILGLVALDWRDTEAHKAVTSPYKFNEDIFPILRDQCASCHVANGVAPMSLTMYNDTPNGAVPWAESMRELLISQQMPPWYVDAAGPAVKGAHPISARDVDKLITWAAGGTPEGDIDKRPAAVPAFKPSWKGGEPDLKLEMPAEHTMPEGTSDETATVTIPTNLTEARWLKMVDVLPGAPQVVRNVVVSVVGGPVLAMWVPGDTPVAAPAGTGFKLDPGAKLTLEIHYKKQWQLEGQKVSDKSTVGLYFTTPPASGKGIQALDIDGAKMAKGERPDEQAFAATLTTPSRVVALTPSLDQVYGTVDVHAVSPSGAKVPLLLLRLPRPEWRRRYWLEKPADLPANSKIEVTVTPPPEFVDLASAKLMKTYPLQVSVDFVQP